MSGTRWLLLRGLAREAGHWGPFLPALHDALGPGHAVEAMDLPGNGVRHAQRSPASVPALAAACRAQLPPGPPPVVIAMSLGAMVAVEWARAAPGALAGCVLVNTSLGAHSPFWERLRPAQYAAVARLLLPGTDPATRERRILAMTSAAPQTHGAALAEWLRIAQARPVRPRNALAQLVAAARYRAPQRPPGLPLLVVASARDGLVHPRCSERLARAWGVPLRVHPTAGHDLPLDDPAWLAAAIRAWWAAP